MVNVEEFGQTDGSLSLISTFAILGKVADLNLLRFYLLMEDLISNMVEGTLDLKRE